jgi:hypothetical protein
MRHAHRRPAREDLLAVGEGGRRQDRDPWPGATRRGQQAGIELGHLGEELAGADERNGSGHGRESTHLVVIVAALRHCVTVIPRQPPVARRGRA